MLYVVVIRNPYYYYYYYYVDRCVVLLNCHYCVCSKQLHYHLIGSVQIMP